MLPVELVEADEENKGEDMWAKMDLENNLWSREGEAKGLKQIRLIKKKKIVYEKPLLVIYNPHSGKKKDFVPKISARLDTAKIPFEMIPTKQMLDPYNFAKTVDLDKYSMMVAVGGDGTVHEVINGMLFREDKK